MIIAERLSYLTERARRKVEHMERRRTLPIGNDDFRKLRENNAYYVDKSLMIKDFIEMKDEVALITRPRRFGKTLNMTMLREFFDITKNSRDIFEGLAIMDTEYANQINSRPVIYFTFKDCRGATIEELIAQMKYVIRDQYVRYDKYFSGKIDRDSSSARRFYGSFDLLMDQKSSYFCLSNVLLDISRAIYEFYGIKPFLLIDEYDQPIRSSYEYGYFEELKSFFADFYGNAMRNDSPLGQSLLTGIQCIAKEKIFAQCEEIKMYTVRHRQYAPYFGLTVSESEMLLKEYGLKPDENIRKKYAGYRFGGIEMYNPWSILIYADPNVLEVFQLNTASKRLARAALKNADSRFWDSFEPLASGKDTFVELTLETAHMETGGNGSRWGLLVNAGYLTVIKWINTNAAIVKITNDEMMSVFQKLIAETSGIDGLDLQQMLHNLLNKDMKGFCEWCQYIVITCVNFMDTEENAYNMLCLGMCITFRGNYKVTSNIENGYGRNDITLEALKPGLPHVIMEFKQGEDLESLKYEALSQILDQKYYVGLKGKVLCVGLAHDKKRCEMAHKELTV